MRSVFGTPPDPYLAAAPALARSARAGCGGDDGALHAAERHHADRRGSERRSHARPTMSASAWRLRWPCATRTRWSMATANRCCRACSGRRPEDRRGNVRHGRRCRRGTISNSTEEIAPAIAGPMIDVQFGPAGVQWCSRPLLEAIAESSAATGRRVHMHLLETIYQRAWADRGFPDGIVRYLRDIGLLSDRLTLAHCIHARPDELDMIAEVRRTHRHQFQLEPASAFGPGADCRCASARLRDRGRRRWSGARRRRRCAPRNAAGADDAWRARLPAHLDPRRSSSALAVRNGRRATGAPGTGELAPARRPTLS